MATIRYPQGNVLLRNLSRDYPVITGGRGVWLEDEDGRRYLDASGGAMVVSVGHGVGEIAEAVRDQLAQVGYVNGTQFTTRVTEELAEGLAALAPPGLDRAAFLGSGSEAVEAAVKFVRQLWVERGHPERSVFIARTPGYHGNTLYALSASARPHYRKFFDPLLTDVRMIEAPYGYRSPVDYETKGADHYAAALEREILAVGADRVAAFLFEPVIGSSAGASTPPPGYFEKVTAICRRHGILMIADEVLCGSGRTGEFFASKHYGLEPDLIVLGKGLNGGYAALSAVLVRSAHVEEMRRGSGYFMHAQTYLQAPCMTAAGLAVLRYMRKHDVLENARSSGAYLHERLRAEILPLAPVGNVAGLGCLAGVEFVADRATKRPFPRAEKRAEKLLATALENGLTLWPNVGQADGTNGDLVMLAPPLTITKDEVDELIARLKSAILKSFEI